MHSVYLKCDECDAVIDRRAKNDFGGSYRKTESRGTFACGEHEQLFDYAKTLGWQASYDKHLCPLHRPVD